MGGGGSYGVAGFTSYGYASGGGEAYSSGGGGGGGNSGGTFNNINTALKAAEFVGVTAALGKEIAIEVRQAMPIMKKVGMANGIKTIAALGTASKYFGWAGHFGAVLGTALDYQQMQSGQLSGSKFGYNTIGTAVGVGVGISVGTIPGAVAGGAFFIGQKLYEGYQIWQAETGKFINNVENGMKNGWVPGSSKYLQY